jgi:TonB family protein
MMLAVRIFAPLVFLAGLLAGCGSSSTVRRANVDAIYDASVDSVSNAFRLALQGAGLVAHHISATGDVIDARIANGGETDGVVTIRISADTSGATLVGIETASDAGPIPDVGLSIVSRVNELLDIDEPRFKPQYIFPPDSTNCTAPSYAVDEVTPPSLTGGPETLYQRIAYPREARATKMEGRLVVTFVVDEEGKVPCAMVVSGLSGGLNRQAVSAVIASDFSPGLVAGEPRAMRTAVSLSFVFQPGR